MPFMKTFLAFSLKYMHIKKPIIFAFRTVMLVKSLHFRRWFRCASLIKKKNWDIRFSQKLSTKLSELLVNRTYGTSQMSKFKASIWWMILVLKQYSESLTLYDTWRGGWCVQSAYFRDTKREICKSGCRY